MSDKKQEEQKKEDEEEETLWRWRDVYTRACANERRSGSMTVGVKRREETGLAGDRCK